MHVFVFSSAAFVDLRKDESTLLVSLGCSAKENRYMYSTVGTLGL